MAATGFETTGSRNGDLTTITRSYRVESASDEQEVLDWVKANTPTTVQGLPRSDFSFDEIDEVDGDYEVEVTYTGVSIPEGGDFPVDQVDYRFNFQATSAHIYQSLSTIGLYDTNGANGSGGTAPDHKGAINVVQDASGQRVEGITLPTPAETFVLSFAPAYAQITPSYQLLVEGLVGLVNSTSFKGRPAGSLMLARCSGSARNFAQWQIEFGFAYIANATNIPVGDITVSSKDGWDLLWPFYESDTDATAKSLIRKPRAAYVERVFYRADFNSLGI